MHVEESEMKKTKMIVRRLGGKEARRKTKKSEK